MTLWLPWKKPKTIFANTETAIQQALDGINFPNITFDVQNDGKRIAALLICSKILAQDIGRLPLKIYKTDKDGNKEVLKEDRRYIALHNHPNKYTDSYKFWSTVEFIRSSTGNAYVKINYDINNKLYLELLDNDCVAGPVLVTNASGEKDLIYKYKEENKDEIFFSSGEILHFTNISSDGLSGRDPKDDLNLNLGISYKALTVVDNFYNNGAIATKALETTIPEGVNPLEWQKQIDEFNAKYQGYYNSNKTIVLAPFSKLVDVTAKFADAEFISTIKYNNGQIASYYGIPQHKIGNIESSKFNALSDLQEDYIKNTISPIISMYRRELELKLLKDEELIDGYSIEFESGALVITDSKTRMEIYKNLFGMGSMTPNQIAKLENIPSYQGGDDHYLMSNYMSVEKYNQGNLKQPSATN